MSWSLSGNSESITAANTTVVTINTDVFYISRIPFETRQIVGGPALTATPDTLELTQADTSYTRGAVVDGKLAVLPAGKETFEYGAFSQGLIERIDLVIGETYAEWSTRIFGSVVDGSADADGDGKTTYEEFLAGTDPQDPSSSTFLTGFAPLPAGGFSLTFATVPGHLYDIHRSTDLETWQPVIENIPGTGNPITHPDNPGTGPKFFYRIIAREPD